MKPAPLVLPTQTPTGCRHLDPNGIARSLQLPANKPVYNPYVVAWQAAEGVEQFSSDVISDQCKRALQGIPQYQSRSALEAAPVSTSVISRSRKTALNWLITNAATVPGESGLLWYYEFPNTYNNVSTQGLSRWSSAFGQAFVLKAFNKAYQDSGDPKYKQYALRAASGYKIPLEKGGFMVSLSPDAWFYEEMPVTPSPFILNGHLVSIVALLETYKLYKDPSVLLLAQKGLNAAKDMLPRYDVGYWSRYDLNPRSTELHFRIRPVLPAGNNSGIPIHSLSLRAPDSHSDPINLKPGDDFLFLISPQVGAWRIGGDDWDPTRDIDGRSALIAMDNSGKYAQTGYPKGSSSFNTNFVSELPILRFSNNLAVPGFELLVAYKDAAKGSLSVDLRDIRNGNAPTFIPLQTIHLSGDQKWKTMVVPVKPRDLAWYVGIEYQQWHIKLLNQLYDLTGDRLFRDYARRWQCYVDHQHDYDSMQLVKYPRCN